MDWKDNAPVVKWQELEIDNHMDLNFDLFYRLDPNMTVGDKVQGLDRSAFRNMKRMTPTQLSVFQNHYAPSDAALKKANLSGKDLVRWKYQRYAKNHLRCVRGVDESVGTVMQSLERLGIADNTIVIYSSDQGFYIGDHGWFDKRWMYEESLKMPFIIKWPGVTKPGSVDETHMIQNLDYAPTFLEAAGTEAPADLQGHSLAPLLRGESPEWRKSIYYHYYEYPSVHMVPRHNGVRTETHKLIHFFNFDQWELYDLKNDPDELTNLYNQPGNKTLIADLKQQLKGLITKYQDTSVTPEYSEGEIKKLRKNPLKVSNKL
jgi:arylsulfatase A-like enzyme